MVPSPRHPLWGSAAGRIFQPFSLEGLAAPGLGILGLALLGRWLGSAQRRPWTWMGLVAGVLGLFDGDRRRRGRRRREDSLFLYYATVHGRPLVSGSIARYPTRRLTRLTSDPLYRQVLALEDEPGYADPPTFTGTDLATAGIGFVVLHRDRPAPRAEAYLQGLGLSVLVVDGTVVVLRTPAAGT